jgi:carbonic anhydrase/acetyltransferase-like protein (isoleucine patch superfamily)
MTAEQAAAYVIAQAACANAEIAAMQRTNADVEAIKVARDSNVAWDKVPYSANDFRAVIERHCIGHNAVMQLFQDVSR